MVYKEFEQYNKQILDYCQNLMKAKNKEYADSADVVRNFVDASQISGESPAKVAFNYDLKHIVSIKDIVSGDNQVDEAKWREKITDYLNYGLIMNAIMMDKLKKDNK